MQLFSVRVGTSSPEGILEGTSGALRWLPVATAGTAVETSRWQCAPLRRKVRGTGL